MVHYNGTATRMQLRSTLQRYGRHISSISLIGGFVFDFFTLWRIDLWQEDIIFIIYLVVGAVCIGYLCKHEKPFALFVLQFVFGGLFGRFFIFYSRSGELAASWPFLLFLLALLAGNEILRKRYLIFTYRMSVYFIALFSFAIFYVPIIAGEISERIFLVSGVISLMIMGVLIYVLGFIMRDQLRRHFRMLAYSIGVLYAIITAMYFANIIPPIPLSLAASGVYHAVRAENHAYVGSDEQQPWYARFQSYPQIHLANGEPVYVFASVFAPTHITTTIIHRWEYYDEYTKSWKPSTYVSIPIVGGRDGGYRGYSYKEHTTPGRWRVNISTTRGQLIGRVGFTIVPVDTTPPLSDHTL